MKISKKELKRITRDSIFVGIVVGILSRFTSIAFEWLFFLGISSMVLRTILSD